MREASWAFSTFWPFTVLVDRGAFGMDSRALLRSLDRAKVQTARSGSPFIAARRLQTVARSTALWRTN